MKTSLCRALALLIALSVAAPAADYLSPELRYRVERLKVEARSEPSSPANGTARADVLWDWANAYALTGQPIPQDLPLMIRSVRGRQESGYPGPTSRVLNLIDFYIWELTLKDEDPAQPFRN